jgi:hypothetical protein
MDDLCTDKAYSDISTYFQTFSRVRTGKLGTNFSNGGKMAAMHSVDGIATGPT